MFKLNDTKPESKKSDFEPLKSGSYVGILKTGYVKKIFDSKYDKSKTKISLAFEVPSVTFQDSDGKGQPRSLFLYETLATGDKSNLHKILLSNLSDDIGMTFEDIQNPFDIPETNVKYALTGFFADNKDLFGTEFEILVGNPKNSNSNFNVLHSVNPFA